jgi:hypothetical protein
MRSRYAPISTMWIVMLFFFTILLFGAVAADVLITYPAGGETLSGVNDNTITWIESNIVPTISNLDSYTIVLYMGDNDNYVRYHPSFHNLPLAHNQQTEMASTTPSPFTSPTPLSNVISWDRFNVPNSKDNA